MNSHTKTKDYWDDDPLTGGEEAEDAEILKSLAYAEKKLGSKMGTPKKMPSKRGQPIMYDIEATSTDSADRIGEELSGMLTTEE